MKFKRFKLNALSAEGLRQKEMNAIVGGSDSCRCSCYYQYSGGSISSDNMNANYNYGYNSNNTCNLFVKTESGLDVICRPKVS